MPPTLKLRPHAAMTVDVELLTRQFGGGATARAVDADQWLRSASVRGALRFWWRALQAHTFEGVDAMREAEAAIFGRAADEEGGVGALAITVTQTPPTALRGWQPQQGDELNGVYFPASENKQDTSAAQLLARGACATIALRSDGRLSAMQQAQVREALVAWVTFGGSGARTRRGAGAVAFRTSQDAQRALAPTSLAELDAWLGRSWRRPCAIDTFSIARTEHVFRTAPFPNAEDAQRALARMWRAFRQDRAHPEDWMGLKGWGRSRWPEADVARRVHHTHARWEDGTDHAPMHPEERGAPRAWLGLPIVLHFKDGKWPRSPHDKRRALIQRDPTEDTHIVAVDARGKMTSDRYASPVLHAVARVFSPAGHAAHVGVVLITEPARKLTPGVKRPSTVLDAGPWPALRNKLAAHIRKDGRFTEVHPRQEAP